MATKKLKTKFFSIFCEKAVGMLRIKIEKTKKLNKKLSFIDFMKSNGN